MPGGWERVEAKMMNFIVKVQETDAVDIADLIK